MICKRCKGTSIKSRTNYSHGKNSRSTTILICNNCGSSEIDNNIKQRNNRGFKRK
jgi:RNase P subunit RPR2